MRFTSSIIAAILAFATTGVLAAPLPQLAGEGNACDSVLTSTDSGVGYGTENAEDNAATTVTAAKTASGSARRRQLAGEGNACGSILTDTDSGVGYGVENAEDNAATSIGGTSTAAPAGSKRRRQANKIAAGAATLSDAAGTGEETAPETNLINNVDGQTTDDATTDGAQVGSDEETTLEQAGSDAKVRRQANKIAAGAATLSDAAGTGEETAPETNLINNVDGQTTDDATEDGAQVGSDEETTLEQAGSDA